MPAPQPSAPAAFPHLPLPRQRGAQLRHLAGRGARQWRRRCTSSPSI
jgi:hypothetical protein